ncbi:GAF domain-containing protein [Anaerolinea thermolimosa]|uniref:GAF domain-containing protein n=1 Tax=Anaerolinea thermolimosa TaxID=229919 RepID=UPI0013B42887|nr:GAF domain-containing protein [Anaerolinea thermolimosa]
MLREQRTRKLGELSAAVNTPYKTVDILKSAITTLGTLMEMDAGVVGLLDREDQVNVIVQAEYLRKGMRSYLGERILLDQEHAHWAKPIWNGNLVIVTNLNQMDAPVDPLHPFRNSGVNAILALPIFADEKLYGLLGLFSCTPRRFSEDDVHFARSASAIVSNAVAKAERLAQARRYAAHMAVADAVAQRLLTSNDIKHLPQQVVDTLSRYYPQWNIYVFLKQDDLLVLTGSYNAYHLKIEKEYFRLTLDEGLIGTACRERKVVLANNVHLDPKFVPGDPFSPTQAEICIPIQSGEEILGVLDLQSEQAGDFTREDVAIFQNVALDIGTALINARLMEKDRQHHLVTERLQSVTQRALSAETLEEMLPVVCAAVVEAVHATQASIMLIDAQGYCYRWAGYNYSFPLEPHKVRENGISMSVMRSGKACFIPDVSQAQDIVNPQMIQEGIHASACLPLHGRNEILGVLWILYQSPHFFDAGEQAVFQTFAIQAGLIIEQYHQLEQARRRLWELESLQSLSITLRKSTEAQSMLESLLDTALAVFNASHGSILLPDPNQENLYFAVARGWAQKVSDMRLPVKRSLSGRAFLTNMPFLSPNLLQEPEFYPDVAARIGSGNYAGMFAPIPNEERTMGVIFVGCDLPRQFTKEDLHLLTTFSEMVGTALRREAFRKEMQTRLAQLEALHQIDLTITSSHDLQFTLEVFLEQVTRHLGVDAADILQWDPHSRRYTFKAGRNMSASLRERLLSDWGVDYAAQVASERQIIHIDFLNAEPPESPMNPGLTKRFWAYIGIPIIAKGEVTAIWEIFNHTPFTKEPSWWNFMETLAGQAAIAIDNAIMFENIQQSNQALNSAYEKTIEGWSHALDLRDKETEGHTLRVTELTLEVARAMGIGEEQLLHIRRGALLHDIGKMGVPDSILLKPGQLSAEEREIMRKHPTFAYEMLFPIEYLRPALEIPYCHHEKWDGTGYPRGLRGEEIPLAARIFSVIDVYDALTSDRPYRKAWTREKTLEYIRKQAGKHFDPEVVHFFLELIHQKRDSP